MEDTSVNNKVATLTASTVPLTVKKDNIKDHANKKQRPRANKKTVGTNVVGTNVGMGNIVRFGSDMSEEEDNDIDNGDSDIEMESLNVSNIQQGSFCDEDSEGDDIMKDAEENVKAGGEAKVGLIGDF